MEERRNRYGITIKKAPKLEDEVESEIRAVGIGNIEYKSD